MVLTALPSHSGPAYESYHPLPSFRVKPVLLVPCEVSGSKIEWIEESIFCTYVRFRGRKDTTDQTTDILLHFPFEVIASTPHLSSDVSSGKIRSTFYFKTCPPSKGERRFTIEEYTTENGLSVFIPFESVLPERNESFRLLPATLLILLAAAAGAGIVAADLFGHLHGLALAGPGDIVPG